MPIKDMPIFGQYNVQQFLQVCPEDIANWTLIKNESMKKQLALYPAFGRKHVRQNNRNILNFDNQPRKTYKSVDFYYVFDGNKIYRYNKNFSRIQIIPENYNTSSGLIYFTYLVAPGYTLAVFTDGHYMWVHNENTDNTVRVTDSRLIANPTALIAFGNRIAVTGRKTSEFGLSKINLGPLVGDNIDPANCFTVNGAALFAYETENIVNFAVLHNTLYIFLETTTSIWSNIPSVFGTTDGVTVQFPWKKNTTYNFDYGLAEPFAFDSDFGRLVWVGQNQDGLMQVVASVGSAPKPISTQAIDIVLQRDANDDRSSAFLDQDTTLFLYQYQNTVYCRISSGQFINYQVLDRQTDASSIEFNFDTSTWKRCIEVNGERNRVQDHIYFSNRHLVVVKDDTSIYELSGQFFINEVRNPAQTNVQASDAYIPQPFRYERITPQIAEPDYGEFLTDFVQIDFVWGDDTFTKITGPFENAVYIVDEDGKFLITEDDGSFIIAEDGDFPVIGDTIYRNWFKPHIELYYSDDGGISFTSADVLEFSQLGVYSWRMRWYELGPSRNRVYKLIAVSPSPIIILGAIMETRRASGGAA